MNSFKKGKRYDSKYFKRAVDLLYEREVLAERSCKGKAAPYSGEEPRKTCTPAKKSYLLCKFYFGQYHCLISFLIAKPLVKYFTVSYILSDLMNRRVTAEAEKSKKPLEHEVLTRANMPKLEGYLTSKICTVRRDLGKSLGNAAVSGNDSTSSDD